MKVVEVRLRSTLAYPLAWPCVFRIRLGVYWKKLQLMVVPSLAKGYSKSTGLKRQSAYPGEPGKIVFGTCDRPPWRNRQDKIKIAKKEIDFHNFVILKHSVEAQMK